MKTLFSIIFIFTFSFAIFSATFTVTRTDDRDLNCNSGVDCSLREAVNAANGTLAEDTITFALASPSTISLTNGVLIVTGSISINGMGARNLTIQRDVASNIRFGIFVISENGIILNLNRVTIANGALDRGNGLGGGIRNELNSTVNVSESSFVNNYAEFTGGAIYNLGTLNITKSLFSSNRSYENSGAIYNNGNCTITNSTFTNNEGGSAAVANGRLMNLDNVTISHNKSTSFGSAGLSGDGSDNVITNVRNSIVANNIPTFNVPPDVGGKFNSLGNNLIGINTNYNSGFTNGVNGDQVGTASNPIDPKLGELQNNGGQTDTRALLFGSPAIDAGNNSNAPATDQRGFARIVGGTVDIGAYELQATIRRKKILLSPTQ